MPQTFRGGDRDDKKREQSHNLFGDPPEVGVEPFAYQFRGNSDKKSKTETSGRGGGKILRMKQLVTSVESSACG